MEHREYNGWTNYETWLCNCWFDDFSDQAQEAWNNNPDDETDAIIELTENFEHIIGENCPVTTGMYADLLNVALSEINYREIAEHYMDDVEKEGDNEK